MDIMITFVKTFFMNFSVAFSYEKIKGIRDLKIVSLIVIDIIVSGLYAISGGYSSINIKPILMNLICYVSFLIIFSLIVHGYEKDFFIVMVISICFSLVTFLLSSALLFCITRQQIFKCIENSLIEYLIAGIIQIVLLHLFFKIKRFKNGFAFIKEETFQNKSNRICILSCIFILIDIIFTISRDYRINDLSFFIMILGVGLTLYLIKKCITNHYKSKMIDRTVETLTEQLKEKDQTIENLKSELSKTLKINHKYNHRISAMEKAVSKLEFNEEFASEHGDIVALVKELSENYKSELLPADNQEIIQKTNVFAIDNMLEYMATKASKSNIALKVEVKCDVKDITENIIDKNKLETLLADHINDAIIAIQHCTEKSGKILVKFEIHDSIHEVKIYDTGIEFEINTLLQLGKHQVTTHKDSGGSGIGFMTTFETLRACKGSLIIEEYNNQTADYTKAIVARFDNHNEYKICSYRSEEIKIEAEKQEKYDNMENIMPLLAVAKGKQEK